MCVDVEVVNDDRVEDTETFHLEISTTVPRIRFGQSTATVRVEDDDTVEVAMTAPELSVEEGGQVSVCVTRRGVIEKTVTVDLSLEPHTALGEHCHKLSLEQKFFFSLVPFLFFYLSLSTLLSIFCSLTY